MAVNVLIYLLLLTLFNCNPSHSQLHLNCTHDLLPSMFVTGRWSVPSHNI